MSDAAETFVKNGESGIRRTSKQRHDNTNEESSCSDPHRDLGQGTPEDRRDHAVGRAHFQAQGVVAGSAQHHQPPARQRVLDALTGRLVVQGGAARHDR